MEYKTKEDATKSSDWKYTKGLNAGQDSYRVYQSESLSQEVMVFGKNTGADLAYLRGTTTHKPKAYSNEYKQENLTGSNEYIDILERDKLIYKSNKYTVYRRDLHHIIRFNQHIKKVRSILSNLTDSQAKEVLKLLEKTDYPTMVKCINPKKKYYTINKIYNIVGWYVASYTMFIVISDDNKRCICEFEDTWESYENK